MPMLITWAALLLSPFIYYSKFALHCRRTTPRKNASATEPGVLDIVAYRKGRTPRNSPTNAHSPGKPMGGQRVPSDPSQSRHSSHTHTNGSNSKSPEKPPFSPLTTSPPASTKDAQPRTRRYIRGKPQTSPVKPLVKQSSLEEIDLNDPGDNTSPVNTKEKSDLDKVAMDKSSCSTSSANSLSSRFSIFSRKASPPVPPVAGRNLLQAVKTGRRASCIMEADSTHSQTGVIDSSTAGTDMDVSSGHGSAACAPDDFG